MNPTSPPPFSLSEIWWKGIILALSLTVLLFSVWCLAQGITIIFMHLYYFPIVLLAYRYRWKGFALATLLSLAYLGLVIVFDYGQTEIILGALYRFLVFVGIAAVIAYLSDLLAKAQSTMQQSAELRDRYLSLAPAIVLALDRNGAITFLSKHGGEILECIPDDAVGKFWIEQFLPEKDRVRVKGVFSELMAGQVEQNRIVENLVLTCGGAEKIIRWHNTVLHDNDGEISGILGFGEDITEEKWAQDTLHKMQQFQESVITNANVWISVLEPDGTLLVWNDAAEAISGYKKTGVLGKRTVWKQLYPDNEYRKKVTGDIQRIIGRDTFLENFETEIRCADGTKKIIVWNTRGQRDTKGAITSYIAIGRDVTAQKSAEFRAGESSRFLAAMIDTLPIPIFFKDVDGSYLGCNTPFEEYIGIRRDQLIGKTAYDISPKDLADRYTDADRQILENPLPQRYETQVQYADGSRHDVIFYKAPFFNNDGSVGGLIGAYLDISERKLAEEALQESESFNRGLVENLPDYIAVYGQDGKLLYVNPSSARALGYDADTLVGTHVLSYIAEEYHDTVKANMAIRQKEGDALPYEIDMITRDGLHRSVIVKATPIQDRTNPAILLLLIDITERKRMEEELKQSIERFKTVMDRIDALIYVTDMHTFEILFINKYGRDIWGEIEGKVCWQTIQSGQKGPCPFCTNDRIVDAKGKPTGVYQWEFQNTVNGSWYDCRDSAILWTDGRLVRMEIASDITGRKLVEISLRESEEKFRQLFSQMPSAVAIYDAVDDGEDFTFRDFNAAAEKIEGIKKADLIGKRVTQVFPGVKDFGFFSVFQRVWRTGQPEFFPSAIYRDERDIGTWRESWVYKLASGEVIAIYNDVTERKRTEDALLDSEAKIRAIYEGSNDAVMLLNEKGFFDCNPRTLEMFGLKSTEEFVKFNPGELSPSTQPDGGLSSDASMEHIRRAFQNGFERFEWMHRRSNGEDFPVDVLLSAIDYGKERILQATVRDITERKKAEEEIRISNVILKTQQETSPDGILIVDKSGKILSFNRMFTEIWKIPQDVIDSRSDERALSFVLDKLADPTEFLSRVRYLYEHQQEKSREEILLKDGKVFDRYSAPMLGEDNRYFGRVWYFHDITERKVAEAALRESKTLTDAVVENVPLMIFLKEAIDLRFVIFNRAGEELLGYDRQALLGKNNLDLFPPEQAAQFMEKDREVLDGDAGMLDILEEPIMTAKKGLRLLHTRKVCIRGGDGTTKFLLGISEDITERKAAEEALRSSEEQFRVIFHNQQTGLVMVDAVTHTIADANAAALSMIGASRDEVVGKICHTFICPAEKGKCPVTDLCHSVDNSERVLIRANGEKIPILKSVNPVTIGGQPFLIESFVDLSERKRMEKQISESRQLFADIISFLPDPTFVIDKDGIVLAWNRALEQLSGVSAGDMIGKGDHEYSLWQYGKKRPILIDLVLHPDQDAGRLDYTGIHWDGHTVTAQTEIIRPGGSGHKTSLSLVASPLIDAHGKITGAIESMRDISRLKEAEAELGRINQNLEQIVRDRTRLLQDEVAQRMRAEKDVQDALSYTRSVIEANPDLMVVLDRNGTVLDINAAAESLTGISKEQLIGTLYFDYLVDDGTLYNAFSRLLKEGRIENLVRIRHTDGHITPLSINATVIGNKDAPDVRIIVSAHDITRQKKDEEVIRASLDEKVILLREVHHRVKNNLQIIISLVNLQMRQTDDPEVKQIMSETQNRVRAMSLVHEKLYRSESLSRIDFADYTRYLATQLFSFYGSDTKRVRLDFAMGKIMIDINTAVPLGLLMNEIVSNALKHAFPNGREGTISISGSDENNLITLVVRDDGIGIPADFDWKNTTSLGMRLVTSLIDQVDGTIVLDRSQGTTFTITIKREPASGDTG